MAVSVAGLSTQGENRRVPRAMPLALPASRSAATARRLELGAECRIFRCKFFVQACFRRRGATRSRPAPTASEYFK